MKLSYKGLSQKQIEEALENAIAHKPKRVELGGDIYYQCHWMKCRETLYKHFRYCPGCGQKIDWCDAYVDELEKLFFTDTQT